MPALVHGPRIAIIGGGIGGLAAACLPAPRRADRHRLRAGARTRRGRRGAGRGSQCRTAAASARRHGAVSAPGRAAGLGLGVPALDGRQRTVGGEAERCVRAALRRAHLRRSPSRSVRHPQNGRARRVDSSGRPVHGGRPGPGRRAAALRRRQPGRGRHRHRCRRRALRRPRRGGRTRTAGVLRHLRLPHHRAGPRGARLRPSPGPDPLARARTALRALPDRRRERRQRRGLHPHAAISPTSRGARRPRSRSSTPSSPTGTRG